MIRIFETGDLHIGRAYADPNKHPEGAAIKEKRVEAISGMVEKANEEQCDLFVITGDLFDKTSGVAKKYINRTVEMLSLFKGTVLVLPGNHDYYPEDSLPPVWRDFSAAAENKDNIVLLNRFEPYEISLGDEDALVYPAFCQIDTAPANNLGWIRNQNIPEDSVFRIGVAHGAVAGYTIDTEGEYFLMTEEELTQIPMDVWLIGHTHVMFPSDLNLEYKNGGRIFNAGTHVQTDVRNNTDGNCFIIEVEKDGSGKSSVRAKRYVSGNVFFKRIELHIDVDGSGTELQDAIQKAVSGLTPNTSVSLQLSGIISREEYAQREKIYAQMLGGFFEYPHPKDEDLSELISEAFIKSEFSELTFPAKLLMALVDDPKKAQLAYDLLTSEEVKS